MPNAYRSYQRTTIETASPGKLILMLYDGAIRFLEQAKRELSERSPKEAHYAIVRAEDILSELMSSLDMTQGGEIAKNLLSLYEFMFMRLVDANIRKDPAPIDDVLSFLRSLRESWEAAMLQPPTGASSDSPDQLSISPQARQASSGLPGLLGRNGGNGRTAKASEAPPAGDNRAAAASGGVELGEAQPDAELAPVIQPKLPAPKLRQFQLQRPPVEPPSGTDQPTDRPATPDPPTIAMPRAGLDRKS